MIQCRVKWEGPFTVEAVLKMQDADDFGLYQIYGRHVVFGPEKLLYIGRTEQSFGERFQSHWDQWLWDDQYESDISIRLGRVHPDSSDVLADVEAFEIYYHSPPYNSSNINAYKGQPLSVQNDGDRGDLLACISTDADLTRDGLADS